MATEGEEKKKSKQGTFMQEITTKKCRNEYCVTVLLWWEGKKKHEYNIHEQWYIQMNV